MYKQDGWEGACTCSFAPMQGLLTIAEPGSSGNSPSKSGARCEHLFCMHHLARL